MIRLILLVVRWTQTRLELLSIHHLLPLAEWLREPARVATISCAERDVASLRVWICWRPGPSLRLTCWAGTCSPGRTMDMMERSEKKYVMTRTQLITIITTTIMNDVSTPLTRDFPELAHLSYVSFHVCDLANETRFAQTTRSRGPAFRPHLFPINILLSSQSQSHVRCAGRTRNGKWIDSKCANSVFTCCRGFLTASSGNNLALQGPLYELRSETKSAFNEAKALEARWKELEKEQRDVYQVRLKHSCTRTFYSLSLEIHPGISPLAPTTKHFWTRWSYGGSCLCIYTTRFDSHIWRGFRHGYPKWQRDWWLYPRVQEGEKGISQACYVEWSLEKGTSGVERWLKRTSWASQW